MFKFIAKTPAKYRSVLIWLVFLLVAFFIFGSTLNYYFVSDDWHWLWLAKTRLWSWSIFVTNYEGTTWGGSYNPFLFVIWKIFFTLFGLKASAYHGLSLVLHATNACLVYCLGKKIFSLCKVDSSRALSSLAAILFLVWPTQVEAVSWLAAWPHLWATLFYLLSFLLFLRARENQQKTFFSLSILAFAIGLLVKEIVLTLPILILLLECYLLAIGDTKAKQFWQNGKYILADFILLAIFFAVRQEATQTFFGYYGQNNLQFHWSIWLANAQAMILEFASAGYFRSPLYKLWYNYPLLIGIFFVLLLLLYVAYLLIKKKYKQLFLWLLCLATLLPVVPLGLHRTTFAGERYVYLPVIFFLYWFIFLFNKISFNKTSRLALLGFCLLCSLLIIGQKNMIWEKSSQLARQIVASYPRLGLAPGQKIITVGLPDNLAGAEVFRNNLQQALMLTYPDTYPEIMPLPVYLQLNQKNANYHLLNWRRDAKGWWAESIDGSFVVTGTTSINMFDMYWELWHYNYQNYTANLIRLLPQGDLAQKIDADQMKIMTLDFGQLKIIK
ncbi:MAG: hypothetical protein WC465_04085 [Patescibacteria group bacterium]